MQQSYQLLPNLIKSRSNINIQVNLAMSNLLISNTRHMSKWSPIPMYFPYIYIVLYIKPVYFELGYHEISAISKCFFIPEN